jgi:hypothetical protein
MERSYEEATKESARGGAWPAGRIGTERGKAARQPQKWPQGWSGQKPQEAHPARRNARRPRPGRSKKSSKS